MREELLASHIVGATGGSAPTVAAVVVTFNRKALLVECLNALLNQTRPPDCIFVIDQASTDGTPEILEAHGFLRLPRVRYSRFEVNTGGAGGFHRGMQMAHEAGFDWIWVMDDDAEPHPDALERTLPYGQIPGVIAVVNQKVSPEGVLDAEPIDPWPEALVPKPAFARLLSSTFVGLMISARAITNVGLPLAEFFIHFDDIEYCQRLYAVGHIAYASDAIVLHKQERKPWSIQKVLGIKFTKTTIKQYCFQFFDMRNEAWLMRHSGIGKSSFYGRMVQKVFYIWVAQRVLRQVFKIVLLEHDHLFIRLQIMARAYGDSIRDIFDNTYPFSMLKKSDGKS
jgi:GT2 family glycosyltransferase